MKVRPIKSVAIRIAISLAVIPIMTHAATTIERSDKPYVTRPDIQFVITSTKPEIAKPSAVTPSPTRVMVFELRTTDGTVKNAFLRWAEDVGAQVNWQLQSELPLDATGRIEAATLPEAMTEVAKAFATRAQPFVIREYDNTILVLPRLVAHP